MSHKLEDFKSSFRKLTEVTDIEMRKILEEFYIVDKNRMDNLIWCLETGSDEIKKLEQKLVKAEAEIRELEETNALVGYTQSDEISLILYSDKIGSQVFFDGKVQKLVSVLASMATLFFQEGLREFKL